MQNKINLIYFLLDPVFTKEVYKFNITKKNIKNKLYSKKFNTKNFKVKTYDKVSTPFIEVKLFENEG